MLLLAKIHHFQTLISVFYRKPPCVTQKAFIWLISEYTLYSGALKKTTLLDFSGNQTKTKDMLGPSKKKLIPTSISPRLEII